MAGRSRHLAHLAAVAVGRISGDQVEAFRAVKLFQLPQIGHFGTDASFQTICRYTAAHQLYHMGIAVDTDHLASAARSQQQADRPRTGAKLQNPGLSDQMGKSRQKNGVRRKTKFL